MMGREKLWAALLLAMGFALGACGSDEPPAPKIMPAEEIAVTTSDGMTIEATWKAVEGSKSVLVCVPTVGHDRTSWQVTAGSLTRAGYSVLSTDLRDVEHLNLSPGASGGRWTASDSATPRASTRSPSRTG